jgi:hypothetical protein
MLQGRLDQVYLFQAPEPASDRTRRPPGLIDHHHLWRRSHEPLQITEQRLDVPRASLDDGLQRGRRRGSMMRHHHIGDKDLGGGRSDVEDGVVVLRARGIGGMEDERGSEGSAMQEQEMHRDDGEEELGCATGIHARLGMDHTLLMLNTVRVGQAPPQAH